MQIHATWASSSLILLKNRDSRVVALLDHSVKQRRRGTTPCRTRHCLFLAGNHLCRCQVAGPWPYPDGWTFEAVCPWRASSRHAAPLDIFCALSEESSTSSDVRHFLQTAATAKCLRANICILFAYYSEYKRIYVHINLLIMHIYFFVLHTLTNVS